MPERRVAFVHEAELQLGDGTDPDGVGAAVTTALCGRPDHEGPCRWPHNNDIGLVGATAHFRTLFVATATDEPQVRALIERSLRDGAGWVVQGTRSRPVAPAEAPLAHRLALAPPA